MGSAAAADSTVDSEVPAAVSTAAGVAPALGCACSGVSGALHQPPGVSQQPGLPSCLPQPAGLGVPETVRAPYLQRGVDWSRDHGPCFPEVGNVEGTCLERSEGSNKSALFLLGDSHAIAFGPAVFRAVGRALDVKVLASGSCWCMLREIPDAWEAYVKDNEGMIPTEIKEACHSLFSFVDSSVQASDVVALGLCFSCITRLKNAPVESVAKYLKRLSAAVTSKGANLVVLGDYAYMDDAPGCVFTAGNSPDELGSAPCEIPKDDGEINRVFEAELAKNASSSGYLFLPVRDLFCEGASCVPRVPGTQVMAYADFDHVSWDGAEYLAPFICSFFEEHGLGSGLVSAAQLP